MTEDVGHMILYFEGFLQHNVDKHIKLDFFDNGKVVVYRGKNKVGVVSYSPDAPKIMLVIARISALLSGEVKECLLLA